MYRWQLQEGFLSGSVEQASEFEWRRNFDSSVIVKILIVPITFDSIKQITNTALWLIKKYKMRITQSECINKVEQYRVTD